MFDYALLFAACWSPIEINLFLVCCIEPEAAFELSIACALRSHSTECPRFRGFQAGFDILYAVRQERSLLQWYKKLRQVSGGKRVIKSITGHKALQLQLNACDSTQEECAL